MFSATVKNVSLIISHVKWGLDFLLNQSLLSSSSSCIPPRLLQIIDAHTDRRTSSCTSDHSSATSECAVCLCRIDDGEEIRRLRCSHVFHRVCLDRWIGHGQWTCPLCRNHLKNTPGSGSGENRREILVFGFAEVGSSEDKDSWWLRWSSVEKVKAFENLSVLEILCSTNIIFYFCFLCMESMNRFFWIRYIVKTFRVKKNCKSNYM